MNTGGREVFFCVDIEASGPVPALFNMVSIGAVPVSFRDGAWRLGEERFYLELKPIAEGFDPAAMRVHGIPRQQLEESGIEAGEAMRRLSEFVRARLAGPGARAVFVGHNAAFDWSFVAYYYERFSLPNPFGYKAIDSKSLAMGRLGISWFETNKENLERLLQLPPQDPALQHRADYDAHYQALILSALLNRGQASAIS